MKKIVAALFIVAFELAFCTFVMIMHDEPSGYVITVIIVSALFAMGAINRMTRRKSALTITGGPEDVTKATVSPYEVTVQFEDDKETVWSFTRRPEELEAVARAREEAEV